MMIAFIAQFLDISISKIDTNHIDLPDLAILLNIKK